jgi:UDP-N-acetylglucosamine--N-acetylmuramyl-(pentapeptide) pyrophosphoryl-undecaprenol N-acetylglucosamine transferase
MSKVLFAGAGTAGHVEPALAVALWFKDHNPEFELLFLGTQGGVENRLVPADGFSLALVDKTPFPRKLNLDLVRWPLKFLRTFNQVKAQVKSADIVVGFGGYVAAPAYLAAKLHRLPIIAHEANAKKGMANKLAEFCGATSLRAFGESTPERVGIPLRSAIVDLAQKSPSDRLVAQHHARRAFHLNLEARTILIFGGSLGSVKFNLAVAGALDEILATGVQVIHAVGAQNELPSAKPGYLPMHYIDEMAQAYAAADLVISRSGAVTVAEVGVLGLYSLFVPLPIGNGEQVENAREVVALGGGEILDNAAFTSEWLAANTLRLLDAANSWHVTGRCADFPLNAAEQIALRTLKELRHE